MTTVLVCGARDYQDRQRVFQILDAAVERLGLSTVIHGAGTGADALGASWATQRRIPCTAFPADWRGLGKAAGPRRNQQMLDEGFPDIVIAFPPGPGGTYDMVERADRAALSGNQIRVITIDWTADQEAERRRRLEDGAA